jgi:tryptophan-rich sensory protein
MLYTVYACVWIGSDKSMDGIFYLNLTWVVVFFGLKNIGLATYIIMALIFVVVYQAYQQWLMGNIINTLLYASWLLIAKGINFDTTLVKV